MKTKLKHSKIVPVIAIVIGVLILFEPPMLQIFVGLYLIISGVVALLE